MTDAEQKEMEEFRSTIDTSKFVNDPYVRRVEKPWGYELHWVPEDFPYMGKIEHINEGMRMSLQVHDEKLESWFVMAGNASVIIENTEGEMEEIEMKPGMGYTCKLGQKHRLKGGKGGCDIIEVSTPEFGNTYRLEDDFDRSTETEAARVERNKEAVEES